jgi:hypothetical protein
MPGWDGMDGISIGRGPCLPEVTNQISQAFQDVGASSSEVLLGIWIFNAPTC